ncbi:MAG: phenylalanine--tRNA ligase subunit beta [bacterium]|nr:phenylalanine--tRNA ligase subunit beta [bacterium]
MIVPLTWLKQYVNIKSTPAVLAERLTLQAAEVEEIIEPPLPVTTALVATVIDIKPHPNADRLKLVTVTLKGTTKTIVCGAPNVEVEMVVPFIPVGGYYFDNEENLLTLGNATIRGIDSAGMLASERDLGISDSHSGLMVLPDSAKNKKTVSGALELNSAVFKLEITPNRSDLFSIIGLAREVSYIEKTRLTLPSFGTFSHQESLALLKPTVKTDFCSRYCTIVINHIENQNSPSWLSNRLRLASIRPINAIVDITNYVMLEYGQPLHAFDYDQLKQTDKGVNLEVRPAKNNETLIALDGVNYQLKTTDTVIADDEGVLALAGIIGGTRTAVSYQTKTILLESAIFHPGNTRRTANRLGLRTESLTRFEKGLDPDLQIIALKRAATLINDICGGKPTGKLFDLNFIRKKTVTITVSLERIRQLVGINFEKQFAKNALSALGFQVTSTSQFGLRVTPPSWRLDIEREEDIVEELVRLYGYDNLPNTLPIGTAIDLPQTTNEYSLTRSIRSLVTAAGVTDIISQPFLSSKDATLFHLNKSSLVKINNPTTVNEQYLRPNITSLLLRRVGTNSIENESLLMAEIGHVFSHSQNRISESVHLGLVSLTKEPVAQARLIKGILSNIGIVTEKEFPVVFSNSSATSRLVRPGHEIIITNNKRVGWLGLVSNTVTQALKLKGNRYVVAAELNLDGLINSPSLIQLYQKPSIYPASSRDLSLSLPMAEPANLVITHLKKGVDYLKDVLVIDEYYQPTWRSLTLRFVFQSDNRTLTESNIDGSLKQLKHNISSYAGLAIREQ